MRGPARYQRCLAWVRCWLVERYSDASDPRNRKTCQEETAELILQNSKAEMLALCNRIVACQAREVWSETADRRGPGPPPRLSDRLCVAGSGARGSVCGAAGLLGCLAALLRWLIISYYSV